MNFYERATDRWDVNLILSKNIRTNFMKEAQSNGTLIFKIKFHYLR